MRDDGQAVLKLRVRAAPEKGEANRAVLALLAEHLSCPRSALRLVSGETSRLKTLEIEGELETLIRRVEALIPH